MNNIQKKQIEDIVGFNSCSDVLYNTYFQKVKELIENGEVTLDEFVDCVRGYSFWPACDEFYRRRNIKRIATEINGLNEHHILKLGYKYKWALSSCPTHDFLNFAPIVSNALVSYYVDCAVINHGEIVSFVRDVNSIPDFANIRLANAVIKYFSEYALIDIDDIINLINQYWHNKIINDVFSIIIEGIIKTNHFKDVYKFAKSIDNIPEDIMKTIVSYVASTKQPEFIYLFLGKINLSVGNTKILTDAIMGTENTDYISYSSISLGYKETNKEEFQKLRGELITYLVRRGVLDFPISDANNCLKELEEKLLNSDNSIENPFEQDEDSKRIRFVRPEETAEGAE